MSKFLFLTISVSLLTFFNTSLFALSPSHEQTILDLQATLDAADIELTNLELDKSFYLYWYADYLSSKLKEEVSSLEIHTVPIASWKSRASLGMQKIQYLKESELNQQKINQLL